MSAISCEAFSKATVSYSPEAISKMTSVIGDAEKSTVCVDSLVGKRRYMRSPSQSAVSSLYGASDESSDSGSCSSLKSTSSPSETSS